MIPSGSFAGHFVDQLRQRPRLRWWVATVSGAAMTLSGLLWCATFILAPLEYFGGRAREALTPFIGLFGVAFLVSAAAYFPSEDAELGDIRKRREKIEERFATEDKAGVLGTIQLSLNQLTEYYAINKAQARRSFNFSVVAIGMGLITLVSGIWLHCRPFLAYSYNSLEEQISTYITKAWHN